LVFLVLSMSLLKAQKVYLVSGGEMIFQHANVEQQDTSVNTNLRFTLFFHMGEYVHYDITDAVGLFSGLGIRNVGLITEKDDIKTKYRTYNLGIPLALKVGSFKKNFFVFAGGEYEWMFTFKNKVFHDNIKSKKVYWFSDRTPHFIPSVFAGMQLPMGFQLKFRYYLDNYLTERYTYPSAPAGFNKSQVWYISVSYQIRNNRIREAAPAINTDMAQN
jgi:hypothetical protein